ncbi:MAG TPA: hypothetical protein ENN21_10945 [Spirochaetes bacterium]|nr:hypothetical protein [Spirochaetota bacterium]
MPFMNRLSLTLCALALAAFVLPGRYAAAGERNGGRPTVGLVLSGGGAKGIAHVGVIKVLEEAGIRVDYIAGTSMGGIVGALYAIGYDAATLEKLALTMDWQDMLSDTISHRDMSLQEKIHDGRYAFSFPLRGGRISLPRGFTSGQKLMKELTRLTLPVHDTRDFSRFAVPFLCVATDIETGRAKIFNRGYLPDALRASMAIPSVFTPVEIDGRLYVDGGVVLNFPVSEARKMGADIIIGVDVQAPLYKKDQLDSLAKIMEQSVYFLGEMSNEKERRLCDILITPDIAGFDASSFENPAELIRRGEAAARALLPQLLTLAKMAPRPKDAKYRTPPEKKDEHYITHVRVRGLKNVSRSLVKGALALNTPVVVTTEQIEKALDRVYGTMFFERVDYRLEPDPPGEMLVVRVVEDTTNFFKLGLHYDSDMNAALLLNATFRNIIGEGSKLSFDLNLSENPMVETSYIIQTGIRPGIGAGVTLWYSRFDVYVYENDELIANLDYTTYGGDLMLFTTFSNPFALGVALQKQFILLEKKIAPADWVDGGMDFWNYYVFLMADTLDRVAFTRRGLFAYIEAMKINADPRADETIIYGPVYKYSVQLSAAIPAHRRLTVLLGSYAGTLVGDPVYAPHLFYLGSVYTNQRGIYPFLGLHFMEVSGKNMAVVYGALQVEPWKDIYFSLKANAGNVAERREDLADTEDPLVGYGMSMGMLSALGPLEFTVARGTGRDDLILHVNIGYRF